MLLFESLQGLTLSRKIGNNLVIKILPVIILVSHKLPFAYHANTVPRHLRLSRERALSF